MKPNADTHVIHPATTVILHQTKEGRENARIYRSSQKEREREMISYEDKMILHRRTTKNDIQYEDGACNTQYNPH
jgi:hypothetical protein